ncbi:Ankyrin repeats (3 copies) [Popillia japonica]|uniref:Ankyrin repeats (3 copies) n=1 Tax=Popillia japonica TaxID=7064 RepID=A0AAW1MCA9_POPJA
MAVKLLLENNANSDITNINGETPLDVIVDKICADLDETNRENLAIISMILCEHVRKVNVNDEVVIKSFYWAAEKGHLNIIKLLVRHGINVNLQNYHGYTPLHIAVVNNHKGVVKTLLENGADIGVKTTDEARICEYS